MKGDWESSKEKIIDLLEDYPNDVNVLKTAIFLSLARDGDNETALE